MRTKTIALTISLVFVSVAMGFQNNPQLGTWKLNEAKSKFAGKARNHTVVYEAAGDQTKITVDGVGVCLVVDPVRGAAAPDRVGTTSAG